MSELAATARSLREVRAAYQDFLMQWALEEMTANAQLMAYVAGDVLRQSDTPIEKEWLRSERLFHRLTRLDD